MNTTTATTQFGMPTMNIVSNDIQQQYADTCAIKSQEILLNMFGEDVTEDELCAESCERGWYDPNGNSGTSMEDVGKLMELHGFEVNQIHNASIFNLVNELGKGGPVIAGVDSGELWNPGVKEQFEDIFINPLTGGGADHALIISGIEFNDDFSGGHVNVIDPGTGDFCRSYDLEQFQDAWADSGNFMVSVA